MICSGKKALSYRAVLKQNLYYKGDNMLKKTLLLIFTTLLIVGCGSSKATQEQIKAVASFYPMAEFTRAVGGQRAAVEALVPDGVEPHDWEPTPRDLTRLGKSQLFVYNGHVESWANSALDALSERKITPVEAGDGLYKINGRTDPHVWVSPAKALVEVDRITEAFCKIDAQHSDSYKSNSAKYSNELKKLDAELRELSKTSKHKKFITAHAAFGHLAADYNLEQLAIAGISPEAEPTPKDLQRLIKLVKQEQVRYIFMETLASPKLTELIAKETGAKILVLDPIEGLDEKGRKAGLTYIKIMQNNITNLRKALNE